MVVVVPLFLSLKDPGYDPGVWWLSFSWGLAGADCADCAGGCRAGADAGFKFVICVSIKMQINILNSIKQEYPKLMYEVSLMCSCHLCSDK